MTLSTSLHVLFADPETGKQEIVCDLTRNTDKQNRELAAEATALRWEVRAPFFLALVNRRGAGRHLNGPAVPLWWLLSHVRNPETRRRLKHLQRTVDQWRAAKRGEAAQ